VLHPTPPISVEVLRCGREAKKHVLEKAGVDAPAYAWCCRQAQNMRGSGGANLVSELQKERFWVMK
jgi:hypothetical protein